jgi:hypothetical protein
MSPVAVTYIGFVIAVLILIWGIVLVCRRYFWPGKQKVDPRIVNTWVPLKPNSPEDQEEFFSETPQAEEHDSSSSDIHTRAQQNGHHSESQRKF